MLYDLLIQGEDARWELSKKAEQEAQRRDALRTDVGASRLRKRFERRKRRSPRLATPSS
jgi:hypothetical protein